MARRHAGPTCSARAPPRPAADFFASGGGSLAAARLVSLVRAEHPTVSVGDVYHHPTLAALAARLDDAGGRTGPTREIAPVPRRAGVVQTLAMLPLLTHRRPAVDRRARRAR